MATIFDENDNNSVVTIRWLIVIKVNGFSVIFILYGALWELMLLRNTLYLVFKQLNKQTHCTLGISM